MDNPFRIDTEDTASLARTGSLTTRRGAVETPVFMPVGTQAAIKTLSPEEVEQTGSRLILANTYHLMLRPGADLIRQAGGVQRFMGWPGPVLTDSGGYQVFSLAERRTVRESGVEFRSHLDGRKMELTPESALDLQAAFGSDIIMPLDELAGYDDPEERQQSAAERTQHWLCRTVAHFDERYRDGDDRPLLFGITQGGFDTASRTDHARRTSEHDLDGHSIGGLSVGEPKSEMLQMLEASVSGLSPEKPRYLMGVGSPEDLWEAVSRGVDMFDCVHPTRVARRGAHYTADGRVNITASRYRDRFGPIDPECDCYACLTFSTAYVHHLFRTGEMLGPRLATIHNLRFIHRQMERIRAAIRAGGFDAERRRFFDRYQQVDEVLARDQRDKWRESRARKLEDSGKRG